MYVCVYYVCVMLFTDKILTVEYLMKICEFLYERVNDTENNVRMHVCCKC